MSFTSVVKNEVSKLELEPITEIAELSAIIANSYISKDKIGISTENASVARRIYKLIKEVWGIIPKVIVRRGYNYHKNYIYIIEINSKSAVLLAKVGITLDNILPEKYIIDDEDSLRAYIRGLFLITGSINDPKTSRYHLEFLVDSEEYALFMRNKINTFYLGCKYIKRENKYMLYVKEAEKIGDFLRIIGAKMAVLYYEDIRIYRDHKNMTNRLNNCEQANVDKIIASANDQLQDIELIKEYVGLDVLTEKEQIAAIYREKYPEASLMELAEIINVETNDKITKSGLHHRINKIKLLANKFRAMKDK